MHRSTPRPAYELAAAQVSTPPKIISLFWSLASKHRDSFGSVADFGAADGRFAVGGKYDSYLGVEIDPTWKSRAALPANCSIVRGCAFGLKQSGFDACVGNPPYVRHHDIESPWKEQTASRLSDALGIDFRLDANLYLYFLALALAKTTADGFVGFLLPHEWTTRPSGSALRACIRDNKWGVEIYRFSAPIFPGVQTTASITFIDKSSATGEWRYFEVSRRHKVTRVRKLTRKLVKPLPYAGRGSLWARRGISPGNQKVFVLTEAERLRAKLTKRDVLPAVTSLRPLPQSVATLSASAFRRYFVTAGQRCWLVRSQSKRLSKRLAQYLRAVPTAARNTATCTGRNVWYVYERPIRPRVLFQSCFTRRVPKTVRNDVRAVSVGTTYGIFSARKRAEAEWTRLTGYLSKYPFRDAVIPHARALRKVEVRQLNHVLGRWSRKDAARG